MKNWAVHYKNKYPGCQVIQTDSALDVIHGGEHIIALRKNGAGQWVDESAAHGCSECHDLAPIPKDARVHKVQNDKIGFDEEHETRRQARQQFIRDGKVPSMAELKAEGYEFDEKGRVTKQPAPKA